jgi:hypothetical protein
MVLATIKETGQRHGVVTWVGLQLASMPSSAFS